MRVCALHSPGTTRKGSAVLALPEAEVATEADISALARLRAEQGWQRNDALLGAVQGWPHGRIFVLREATLAPSSPDPMAPVATTSAIAAGPVGVLGNVIVRADYRGRGLGRAIVGPALRWLHGRGVRAVQLDATEDGRPLYTRLGFAPVARSYVGHAPLSLLDATLHGGAADRLPRAALRPADEVARIAALDLAAYGGDRMGLLARVLAQPDHWLYIAEGPDGRPVGYGGVRRLESPHCGIRLGPWVAVDDAAAEAVVRAVLAPDALWRDGVNACAIESEPRFVFSTSGATPAPLALLERLGGTVVLDDVVMRLDLDNRAPDRDDDAPASDGEVIPDAVDAPAPHPEWTYSWLSPMVF